MAARRDGVRTIAAGNLTPVRQLTDVRDVARALTLLLERGEPGTVYNVASGRGVSLRELLARMRLWWAGRSNPWWTPHCSGLRTWSTWWATAAGWPVLAGHRGFNSTRR